MTDFVAADCGIRQLHARFTDAVWRQDATSFGECFARDGEWKIAGMHLHGRSEIAETCPKLLGRCEKIQLIVTPGIVELVEGGAIGRVHLIEFAKMVEDGSGWMTFGVYHDRYVEEEGRWRFARRHWAFKYRGPTDLSAQFVDTPDYGPFPAMPADDEPTYVRKA